MAQMRLDKFLSEMGAGTRSQIKDMAKKGRLAVNGQTEKRSDRKILWEKDVVTVDGKAVSYVPWEYYMLNKPKGVVSATEDGRYPTVIDLIREKKRKDLFPVGRLDIDTEGLLLITNDGGLAHCLLSPKKHVDKEYFVRFDGKLSQHGRLLLQEGLVLEDGTKTMPAKLADIREGEVLFTIREGKFHQVKRMFEAAGCQVISLKRLSMGPLKLDEHLAPGRYRPLTGGELAELKALEGMNKANG